MMPVHEAVHVWEFWGSFGALVVISHFLRQVSWSES